MREIERLAETFNKRIHEVRDATDPMWPEIGTITGTLGLQVNSVRNVIPKGDYLISRHLTIGPAGGVLTQTKSGQGTHPHGPSGEHSQESGTGSHSHPSSEGAHVHDVLIPPIMQTILPGDRVLVVWCGNEPVVTNVLVSS